ncbi:MAG: site-specific integrase, partial [Clostridiales bacterium]|nr:site-specific integrase [Clostridiales bacterium]
IEKRSENTYRIVVSVGSNAKGRKLRKYRTVTLPENMTERQKEKELNRQAVLFEQEVESGAYLDGAKLTFGEFAKIWFADAENRLAPGTLASYKARLEKRIIPAIGHLKLSKIQPHHLMEFYRNLQEGGIRLDSLYIPTDAFMKSLEGRATSDMAKLFGVTFKTAQNIKRGNPTKHEVAKKLCAALDMDMKKAFTCDDKRLSSKTIRHHHGIIRSILSTAEKWNLIASNPATRVDLGKVAKYRPAYYDDEQVRAMLAALQDEPLHYSAMIYLTIDTGLRTGELTGLVWPEINLDKGTITIKMQRQYVYGYGTIVSDPKTEEGFRTITLSETVTALLRQFKKQQLEDRLLFGSAWKQVDDIVFVHKDGSPIFPHYPYRWFTRFLERHGLPKITFHQLRHTNASLLISAGVDLVTLSSRLGHADKNITLNVYSHLVKSKEAQAANRMDIFYSDIAEKA